jgi:hypothetical protein
VKPARNQRRLKKAVDNIPDQDNGGTTTDTVLKTQNKLKVIMQLFIDCNSNVVQHTHTHIKLLLEYLYTHETVQCHLYTRHM